MTSCCPFQAESCSDAVTLYVCIHVCINTDGNGAGLDKRGGEILLNSSAGCLVVLGW